MSESVQLTGLMAAGAGAALAQDFVPAAARAAIEQASRDALELRDQIDGLTVVDTATAARVTELLTLAATTQKRVEETRTEITAPLKKRAKSIEDAVRPLVSALEALVASGKRKVLDWKRAEDERVRKETAERERHEAEASRRAQEQAAAEQRPVPVPPPPPPVVAAPRGVRTDYGTASVRQVWDFEVTDVTKLPAEFLLPNAQAIRQAVRDGAREIPGVRIFQADQVAVRAR